MSIIITGLEMPTERESFNLTIKYNGTVLDTETGMQVAEAYELPPHRRLIDADAVFKRLQKQAMSVWGNGNPRYQIVLEVMDAIRFAPTIIPAEDDIDIQKKFMQNWHEEDE